MALIVKLSNNINMKAPTEQNDAAYNYADFLKWKDNDLCEIIDGKLFKFPKVPSHVHHDVKGNIFSLLKRSMKTEECKIFHRPSHLRFPVSAAKVSPEEISTVVQPDIMIANADIVDDNGVCGSPKMIIEILSPSTSKKDIEEKFHLYEKNKVLEYWIIHPFEETVIVFRLNDKNKYDFFNIYSHSGSIPMQFCKGTDIELAYIFED